MDIWVAIEPTQVHLHVRVFVHFSIQQQVVWKLGRTGGVIHAQERDHQLQLVPGELEG